MRHGDRDGARYDRPNAWQRGQLTRKGADEAMSCAQGQVELSREDVADGGALAKAHGVGEEVEGGVDPSGLAEQRAGALDGRSVRDHGHVTSAHSRALLELQAIRSIERQATEGGGRRRGQGSRGLSELGITTAGRGEHERDGEDEAR
ncbi:MAG: hypothetical protein HYV07_31480 [Deltaproteobacteria bacterium]|nr:hypothetical protein [Deltaproteobacteria bacterium]